MPGPADLPVSISAHLEQLTVGEVSLAVRRRRAEPEAGPHPTVLMLHGWPGTHADWDRVFGALAGDPRWSSAELLAPDLRGYGHSTWPAVALGSAEPYRAYTPAAHAADLAGLLEQVGAGEVVVAGFDLGANLAQRLARSEPERVRGLVLCDPVHPAALARVGEVNLDAELWYQHLHVQPWAAELIAHDRETLETYLRHFYTHWWGRGEVDGAHLAALVDQYSRPGAFEASIGWYRARARGRAKQAADAASTPPLDTAAEILWGQADPITPVHFADSLSESFADFDLRVLPGVGHFAPLEAPAEVTAALVRMAGRLGWPLVS